MAGQPFLSFMQRRGAHLLMALPLLVLFARWGMVVGGVAPREAGLTAEPIDATINRLGLWAIRALCLTLAITPLCRLLRPVMPTAWLAGWRRPLGLWCFAFACLHLLVYVLLDQLGDIAALIADLGKNRFILFGMTTWVLLVPLALTSTRGMVRRLGGRRWQRLHRLIYPAALLAAVHFTMRVKGFQPEPWVYAGVLGTLILARLFWWRQGLRRSDRVVP